MVWSEISICGAAFVTATVKLSLTVVRPSLALTSTTNRPTKPSAGSIVNLLPSMVTVVGGESSGWAVSRLFGSS